ncbi:MAG: hypothetical protein HC903_26950 [Methylacidiphilales bacterium]|nr:hypothetical protein [Candidatus Methylacidiphilales bacterium]NJR18387.1 hypothetical protein [Calothrix sp. CSU_2_0]
MKTGDILYIPEIPKMLGKLEPGNEKAIDIFINLLNFYSQKDTLSLTDDPTTLTEYTIELMFQVNYLGDVGYGSNKAFDSLYNLLGLYKNELIINSTFMAMSKINFEKTKCIINQLLNRSEIESKRLFWSNILGSIDSDSWKVIDILEELLKSNEDNIVNGAINSLRTICPKMPEKMQYSSVIKSLANLIERELIEDSGFLYIEDIISCLGEIGVKNKDAIDPLMQILNKSDSEIVCCEAAENLWKIGADISILIDYLNDIMRNSKSDENRFIAALKLILINPNNPEAIDVVMNLLCEIMDYGDFWYDEYLKNIRETEVLQNIVKKLRESGMNQEYKLGSSNYEFSSVIEHCSQILSYPDFYKAWNPKLSTIQTLEKQFTNTHLQFTATDKTYPIFINAQTLEDETDTIAISQEICNQIYLTIFPDAEIPEVSNAPQLKRIIPQIKIQLQTQKLALILNNCQPNQELITFCLKLTDVLHIALITNHEIEAPLRGFPPNQPNLLSAIQSWIDEIE